MAISPGSNARTPSNTALLVPAHVPFRQWYANRTGLAPPAVHVALPAFVNDRVTLAAPFAANVVGSVFAPHVTAYCA